jgi:hypothetical protein
MIENFESWISARSRKNVRKALRHALAENMSSKVEDVRSGLDAYRALQARRGKVLDLSVFRFLEALEAPTAVCITVWDEAGDIAAVWAGLIEHKLSYLLVGVADSKYPYARWLAMAEFIRESNSRGAETILSGSRVGVSSGNLEFQDRFGFQTRNLKVITPLERVP